MPLHGPPAVPLHGTPASYRGASMWLGRCQARFKGKQGHSGETPGCGLGRAGALRLPNNEKLTSTGTISMDTSAANTFA